MPELLANNHCAAPQPWDRLLTGEDAPRNDNVTITVVKTQQQLDDEDEAAENENRVNKMTLTTPGPKLLPRRTASVSDTHNRPPPLDRRRSFGGPLGTIHRHLSLQLGRASKGQNDFRYSFNRYRQSRLSSRRIRKRVVFKHGDCNVVQGNVSKRRTRYLQDIFTTLVDAQWRWTLLVFALNFLLSWLGFACVWWLIAYTHGDLDYQREIIVNGNVTLGDVEWVPCVTALHTFTSCFLFSVETQHTIGYGGRSTTEECPEAIFVMCLQSITGVFIQAFMVGIVFAKLSRPQKRTQTLLFSRNAVICLRDGRPCLMFRVGDMRKSHIIEAHVRAQLIRNKVTREGEHLPFYQEELKVGGDGEEDKIFFIWPTTIVHKIDSTSPLYQLSATDLLRERFEIVVILEGVIESTGMTTQARSSYLPSEILWGHRFESVVSFKKDTGEYEVDYTLFNNTKEVDTPLCSAKQLDEHRDAYIQQHDTDHLFPGDYVRSPSSDTLDMSSVDSLSLDDRPIEIPVPTSPIPVTITAAPIEIVS